MTLGRVRLVTKDEAPATAAVSGAVAVLAALLATALVAAGCDMPSTGGLGQVIGSGEPVTKYYDFTGFTKVAVDSGFTVDIDYAETSEVSVTVDDNLVKEHLKVELDGDTLRIGLADLWQYRDVTLRARVVMPRITGLEVSGASSVQVTRFASGDPLELSASGASAVHLGPVRAGAVTLDVSGASRVEGSASLGEVAGEVSGASAVGLAGSADGLRLEASGGSRLELFPSDGADRRSQRLRRLARGGDGHGQAGRGGERRLQDRVRRRPAARDRRRLRRVRGGARRQLSRPPVAAERSSGRAPTATWTRWSPSSTPPPPPTPA